MPSERYPGQPRSRPERPPQTRRTANAHAGRSTVFRRAYSDRATSIRPAPRAADSPVKTKGMLIGALLRVPAQVIQRRINENLNAVGFADLRVPHMAALQCPGPDRVRPGILAERAGVSKQAMNQLLRSREGLGYIVRSRAADEGRARLVRFTNRGRAAYVAIQDIL